MPESAAEQRKPMLVPPQIVLKFAFPVLIFLLADAELCLVLIVCISSPIQPLSFTRRNASDAFYYAWSVSSDVSDCRQLAKQVFL